MLNNTRFIANTAGFLEALTKNDVQSIRTDMLIGASRFKLDDLDVVNAAGKRLIDIGPSEKEEDRVIALALLGFEAVVDKK